MCTYSQLKKLSVTPSGGQRPPPLMCQNCTRLAEYISQTVLKLEAGNYLH